MESGGTIYLVVAGGEESAEDTTNYLDSVEILDLNSPEEGWKSGTTYCIFPIKGEVFSKNSLNHIFAFWLTFSNVAGF